MYFTALTTALFATSALAAPGPASGWRKYGQGKPSAPSPFYFTSTYTVVANPNEVINTTGSPVPGQPGAIGYFNYGINSDLDVICYVRLPPPLSKFPIIETDNIFRTSPSKA